MDNPLVILAPIAPTGNNRSYRIGYDGKFLGDDRGFSTLAECEAEIDKRIAIDRRDAVRFDRPVQYVRAEK